MISTIQSGDPYGVPLGTIPAHLVAEITRPFVMGQRIRIKTQAEQDAESIEHGRVLLKARRLARLENRWRAKAKRLA